MSRIDELHQGFRSDYIDYETLTTQLQSWAEAFPEVCALESLATTPEGRELWMLTIGTDRDRIRPAAWVDANMHASELAGSSAALAIAEDLLRVHAGESPHELSAPILEVLQEALVYVVPRFSPDGAEGVLKDGRYIRSAPRDSRPETSAPRWLVGDVDGDGLAFVMRKEDPAGEFVVSGEVPGLMVKRELEDSGPFYKIYPEGTIANFDGSHIPDPFYLSDNDVDLNRNFPMSWASDHKQAGAGRFPLSEVESRAIVEATAARPHIFAWLNLHTFGGVLIRPLGDGPDAKLDPFDRALYKQLEAWAEEHSGYPTVSGFEQFTYVPNVPLHGDLIDYAYEGRGSLAWVCELWDIFERAGLPNAKRFVDRYAELDRHHLEQLARYDLENNEEPVIKAWRKFDHPQLGEVEVGGLDPRFGMWNPPRSKLGEVCDGQVKTFLRVAAMSPRVRIDDVEVSGEGEQRSVSFTVRNIGYLPTFFVGAAKPLSWCEGPWVELEGEGVELVDASQSIVRLGHLQGWGRGRHDGGSAIYFQRSAGSVSEKRVTVSVRGKGLLKLRVKAPRIGEIAKAIEIA